MVKFNGVILSGEVDLNGNQLSSNALKQVANQLKGKSIGFEFNPAIPPTYGKIKRGVFKEGKVFAEAEIDKPSHEVRMYIVPSFIVNKSHIEGAIRVFDDIDLLEMSFTTQPADKDLTPINWNEDN
uniref:Putative structural protein n=1 Tax=viral metagenome TaxID=1070528 RepID=A0A6M3IPL7_9ZZZZ